MPRFQAHFSRKLYKIVHNKSTNSFNWSNVHLTIFRSILWLMEQESCDFLYFLWLSTDRFLRRRGSKPIFFRKLYGTIHNEFINSSSRPDVHFMTFRSILWTIEQESFDFLNFSCMLAYSLFRCRGFELIFPDKLYGTVRNEFANGSSRSNVHLTTFRSILWAIL